MNTNQQPRRFCKQFVNDIFNKYDTNRSQVIRKRELKLWVNKQKRCNPLHYKLIKDQFDLFSFGQNNDIEINKFQLYDYCLKGSRQ